MTQQQQIADLAALDSLELLAIYGGDYGDESPDDLRDIEGDYWRDELRDRAMDEEMYGRDEPYDEYGQEGCCGDF